MSEDPTDNNTALESCKALIERHIREAAEQSEGADVGTSADVADVADSIVFAEVIAAIEEEKGIEVPMDDSTARALRSIDSFAALIHGLLVTKAGVHSVG